MRKMKMRRRTRNQREKSHHPQAQKLATGCPRIDAQYRLRESDVTDAHETLIGADQATTLENWSASRIQRWNESRTQLAPTHAQAQGRMMIQKFDHVKTKMRMKMKMKMRTKLQKGEAHSVENGRIASQANRQVRMKRQEAPLWQHCQRWQRWQPQTGSRYNKMDIIQETLSKEINQKVPSVDEFAGLACATCQDLEATSLNRRRASLGTFCTI